MSFKLKTRTLFSVEVVQIRDISPRMRRITVIGDGLRTLNVEKPAQWMKVFFPETESAGSIGRAYTIRDFEAAAGRMDLDFVLHGDEGPASHWAVRARLGETLSVAGPRGGYDIDPSEENYLLIGDATALPAIAAIVKKLPDGTRAETIIEIADMQEEQILRGSTLARTQWLHSGNRPPGTTGQIEAAVRAAQIDPESTRIWVAGESLMVRAVLDHLLVERGVPRESIRSAGYWKRGLADYHD